MPRSSPIRWCPPAVAGSPAERGRATAASLAKVLRERGLDELPFSPDGIAGRLLLVNAPWWKRWFSSDPDDRSVRLRIEPGFFAGLQDRGRPIIAQAEWRRAEDCLVGRFEPRMGVERVRFAKAHLLGHMALGHLREGLFEIDTDFPVHTDRPKDQSANAFAAELLAPEAHIRSALSLGYSIEKTAKVFAVSPGVITGQLQWMGVLSNPRS